MGYVDHRGLLVPAAFAEAAPARPERGEIATTRDGRDITRGYLDPMSLLAPQDPILMARGAGNYLLYREVLRDEQVAAAFHQRRLAVVSREWEVRPGGDRRIDRQAAEFLRQQLERIHWDAVTDRMLYGVFYGYAVAELLWGLEDGRVVIDAIKVRDRRRFAFGADGDLRLRTSANPNPGERLPPRKFWWYATGADHDDEPYGLGLAHWLYWPVLFKRNGVKFWLVFLEKFGQPTATGRYPPSASAEEKARLLAALAAIQTDAGIILPEGMAIELLEAARSGTADYTALYDRMNAAISKVVLGHTGSSEATPGRLGGEDLAADVRHDLIKADADVICQSFNRSVARWLTDWNFPGAAYPQVWRLVEEPEDLNRLAERDERLARVGYRPTLARVQEVYGEGYEPAAARGPLPPQGEGPETGAELAEPDAAQARRVEDQLALAEGAETLAGEWERLLGPRVEELVALLEETGDLVTFRERLADLLRANPPEALVTALERAGFSAQLLGRTPDTE